MPHPVCGRVKINRTPPSKAGDGCPSRRRWLAGGAGPPAAPSGSRAVAGGCDAAGPSALAAEPAFTAGKQQQQKEELTDVTAEECGTGTGLSGSNAAGLRDGQSRLGRVLRREGAGKNGGSGRESRAEPDASAPPSGERGGVAAVPGNGRSDAGQRDEAAEDEAPIERAGEPRAARPRFRVRRPGRSGRRFRGPGPPGPRETKGAQGRLGRRIRESPTEKRVGRLCQKRMEVLRCPLVSKVSCRNKLVGFHTGLKSPRKKMQGNSAPTLKGVATNVSSCNGGDPSEPATGLSADADCSTLKEAVAGAEGQCDDLETNASRLLGTVEAGSGQELIPAAPGSEAGSKEREEAPDGEKQQQGPAMPSAGSGATEDGFNRSKYCKFFFSATMSCYRKPCRFLHVPLQGDEKFCMEAVEMFLNTCNPDYLQRAVVVFTRYYQNSYPGVYFKSDVLQVLLSTLLRKGLFGGLFAVIQVTTTFGILPSTSLLLQVYKKVKRFGHQEAVPFLLEVTSKCVEAGLELSEDNLSFMQRQLELLQAPRQHIDVIVSMKSRALKEEEEEGGQFDIDEAIAELERCKEQEDWATLGSVFNSVCGTSGSLANLNRFCASVASALLKDLERTPLVPFCKFVETVCQEGRINELGRTLLGRIGISVMFGYHKTQQWTKGRKLLEALNGMKINFFTLKGLLGHERHVSLCQVVNVAADIYLNTGSVEGAINVLKGGASADAFMF
nr:PREDICTED: treacle protein-like [Lepisosteus oculatus]